MRERDNGKITSGTKASEKVDGLYFLYRELGEVYGGGAFYKLCIKSIKRGRQIKRQIVPLVGEKGYISCNTIQTAIGQFHSFH